MGILGLRQMASRSSPSTLTPTAAAVAAEVCETVTPTQRGAPGVRTTSTQPVRRMIRHLPACVKCVSGDFVQVPEQSSSCAVFQRATTSLTHVVINNQACVLIDGLYASVICEILHLECCFSSVAKNNSHAVYICLSHPLTVLLLALSVHERHFFFYEHMRCTSISNCIWHQQIIVKKYPHLSDNSN